MSKWRFEAVPLHPLHFAPYGTILETYDERGTVYFRAHSGPCTIVPEEGFCTCKWHTHHPESQRECEPQRRVREHLLFGPRTCPVCTGLGQQYKRGRLYECQACQGKGSVPVEEVEAWLEARAGLLADEQWKEHPILTDDELRRLFG